MDDQRAQSRPPKPLLRGIYDPMTAYAPVAHQVVDTTVSGPAGMAVYLDLPDVATTVLKEAVKDAVDDLTVATLTTVSPAVPAHAAGHGQAGSLQYRRCCRTTAHH